VLSLHQATPRKGWSTTPSRIIDHCTGRLAPPVSGRGVGRKNSLIVNILLLAQLSPRTPRSRVNAYKEVPMAKLACNFCGKVKSKIWFCRKCRLHFCGDCSGGSFITFACPKGHRDVAKVSG
jgi:ribosomal protein L37AE/L43A